LFGLFLLSLLAKPRLPKLNLFSAILTGLLLLQGWIMVFNPKQRFEPGVFAYSNLPGAILWLPGVVDRATAEPQLLLVTGLIGAFWIAGDLTASRRWRRRTWWVMTLTGISLVGLGLVERLTGARAIFWDPVADTGSTFFATYRYHANAGAFLNLVLPLIAAKAALAFSRRPSHTGKTFWSIAALMTAACAFINVSKAGMVIAAFILLAMAYQQLNRSPNEYQHSSKTRLTAVVVSLALLFALIWAFGFGDSLSRWIELSNSETASSRWLVDQAIVRHVLSNSGWWGFGPGTFQITFPFFTETLGDRVAGVWQNAHQDYLQGLIEWGYFGGAVWAALLFGGLGIAIERHRRQQHSWVAETRLFSSACILSFWGLLLHALVDFPLQIPSLQLYAAVLLGLLWNFTDARGRRKRISGSRASKETAMEQPPELVLTTSLTEEAN
jgi:multisubunit Na+/H+ antiporter MnhB subunit